MNIEKNFILNNDGEDRWVMNVEGKPEIFGVIEKEYNKSKSMFVFSIKYYWNKVLQDKKYADDLETAEEKLKNILSKVDSKVKEIEIENQYEMKNFKSFRSFVNESKKKPNVTLADFKTALISTLDSIFYPIDTQTIDEMVKTFEFHYGYVRDGLNRKKTLTILYHLNMISNFHGSKLITLTSEQINMIIKKLF